MLYGFWVLSRVGGSHYELKSYMSGGKRNSCWNKGLGDTVENAQSFNLSHAEF